MNNQNFYLRLIALLLIIMAVFFYNGTVKDKEQAQDIADLTAKTESLENQQDQILTALKETYEEQKTAAESNASSDVSSEADNKSEKDSAEDKENNPVVQQTIKELEEYFAGNRKVFTVPLDLRGTEFQKKVWEALREIPYGETRSYKEIAEKIGNPKASRAVGMANHRNPIGIVVPCHRVVGANGKLTGYAGGIPMKQALLELEKPM